jgi:hypothetical protein
MGKESKTARASQVTTKVEKKVIPDDVLVRDLRNHRASALYPTVPQVDALLRTYDGLIDTFTGTFAELVRMLAHEIVTLNAALTAEKEQTVNALLVRIDNLQLKNDAQRIIIEGYQAAQQAQKQAVAEAPYADDLVARYTEEAGLTVDQGKDSIGG